MDRIRSWLERAHGPEPHRQVDTPQRMIVGLGNPGPEYAHSRHNVGFQVADLLVARHGLAFDKFQKRARLAIGRVRTPAGFEQRVVVAKPMTYMNASGEAVAPLAAFYKIVPADILVVFDDLDLPAGRIRLRPGGGSGGQKGMQSIIKQLGSEAFPRLRVGIDRPPGQMDPAAYVLRPFSPDQEAEMAFVRMKAVEAIEAWLVYGIEAAMNQFNPAKDE
jgi:peptidyl-tRNA hydrolase, PTH1 family